MLIESSDRIPNRPSASPSAPPITARENAFRHQLTNDPASVGAHRGANRHLASAHGRTDEQQVRNVGAGDEQHARDGGEQHFQQRLRISHEDLLNRIDAEPACRPQRVREFLRELGG